MPQPLDGRVLFAVPVQVIGVTPSGTAFSETAYTTDVSRYGVRLDKVQFLRRSGDHVTLRYAERSARYRVAWVGAPDTPQTGQAGLAILDGEPFLWGADSAPVEHPPVPGRADSASVPASAVARSAMVASASVAARLEISPRHTLQGEFPLSGQIGAHGGSSPRERRATRRYLCDRAVLCWKDGERVPTWGKLRDLSLNGCFVETPVPLAAGEAVSLMLMMYGYKIRARAQVRVQQPDKGMGVEFLALRPEELQKLKQVLEHLSQPGAERTGLLNQEGSLLSMLNCWFETNDSLSREQFHNLLKARNPEK